MILMSLCIPNPGQLEVDSSSSSASSDPLSSDPLPSSPLSSNPKTGSAQNAASPVSSTHSCIGALDGTQDTASISSALGELSGDLPIRQDRVDALRAQIQAGSYSVNSHAVATAMFQNLFRSLSRNRPAAPVPVDSAGSGLRDALLPASAEANGGSGDPESSSLAVGRRAAMHPLRPPQPPLRTAAAPGRERDRAQGAGSRPCQ
jgi:flagellar biosynthesis anti-sigma factor FlgM